MGRAAVLAGVGSAVPEDVVTNDMLATRMDTTDEWIRTRTGIRERRHLARGSATSDLAAEAGRRALKSAGVDSVDAVVLATTTPDHPCPATAPTVAAMLGLGTIPAYDVGAVCSGFLYGLASGAGLIALGTAERVLVIGAEAFTTIIDQTDRSTAPIFGDGAGAVVLSAGDQSQPGALLAFDLGSDGDLADLIIIPGGGSRQRASGIPAAPGDEYMAMRGREVFRHAVLRMTESSRAVLARTGWDVDSVDWLVGHQANVRILRAVAEHLGLAQERAFVNVDRYGNTAAASIPLALDDAAGAGLITPGDRIVLTAFGGGASWGAIALEWPDL
ncbi:beta-ketoacyl-ACP synthase III [Actinokineospora cianjurensis]|uniref:Beta-ketoacyl-[acyl-carrier-protein] synthase III n=1 Tax=Actinokineospora cianjurensis TaxID=585224 RepID=A0A421AZ34_9PSEU|nr:beta-ketoacyl-ACP synthase III [Actinokineospora cianjurensis]RLK55088.1 3-oxoacyl-[acyl-carrier-protein] synthase III [Actinokineospora cianjurensis]